MKLVTRAELRDWIDADQLHDDFGGDFAWDFEEYTNALYRYVCLCVCVRVHQRVMQVQR